MKQYIFAISTLLVFSFVALAGDQAVKKDPIPVLGGRVNGGSQCDATAGNLVLNCGFETGMITPEWLWTGDMGFTGVDTNSAHSGSYGAFLGPVGAQGVFTQTLPTTAGGVYTVSFWLSHDGGSPNNFVAFWDGTAVYSHLTPEGFPYTQVTIDNLEASTDGTNLQFAFREDPSYYHLDDVVVVQTGGASK